jgi:hypothetical protein
VRRCIDSKIGLEFVYIIVGSDAASYEEAMKKHVNMSEAITEDGGVTPSIDGAQQRTWELYET